MMDASEHSVTTSGSTSVNKRLNASSLEATPLTTSVTSPSRLCHRRRSSHLSRSNSSRSTTIQLFGRQYRCQRSVLLLGFLTVFCLLVLIRERHVQEENSFFQMGIGYLKSQTDDPLDAGLQEQQQNDLEDSRVAADMSSSNNNNHQKDNPMQAIGNVVPMEPPSTDRNSDQTTETNDGNDPIVAESRDNDQQDDAQTQQEMLATKQEGIPEQSTTKAKDATITTLSSRPAPKSQVSNFPTFPKTPFDPSMKLQAPNLPLDTSNNQSFVRDYCDLQGADWFPVEKDTARGASAASNTTSSLSWHQRAPYVMLIGPSHSGSDALWQLLSTHPQVADAMRSQFFTFNAKHYVMATKQTPNKVQSKESDLTDDASKRDSPSVSIPKIRIKTRAARRAYMARHVATQRRLQENPSQVVVDSVPETLFYSHQFAPFLLCVMPWTKIVITVSHPIQRLLKQYQVAQQMGLRLSLEDWIARDLDRMQEAGLVLQQGAEANKTLAAATEAQHTAKQAPTKHDAWIQYQQGTPTALEASAGQSLYEYMIHPWLEYMTQAGRNPLTEIVLVQRETLLKGSVDDVLKEYHTILKQLGLAQHSPPTQLIEQMLAREKEFAKTWKSQLDETLRRQLKRFFQPYNKLLDNMVKSTYSDAGKDQMNVQIHWNPELWKQ